MEEKTNEKKTKPLEATFAPLPEYKENKQFFLFSRTVRIVIFAVCIGIITVAVVISRG